MEQPQLTALLSAYRTGELTLAELIVRLEHMLEQRIATVAPMVAALEAENARAPLAPNTFKVLMQRVRSMQDRTLLRVAPRPTASSAQEGMHTALLPTDTTNASARTDSSAIQLGPGSLLAGRF